MSYIWNVILSFSDEEFWHDGEDNTRATCAALDALNKWMPHGKLVDLTRPTFTAKAGCGMSAHLYGGGFRHLDIEGFIAAVQAQQWKDPTNVQLFLKSESDEQFSLHSVAKPQRRRRRSTK
jgi:hypothetical protein